MATELHKPVARKAAFTRDAGRRLVVTLYPGDMLGLRAERTRKEYTITLGAIFSLAVKMELARVKAERAKAKAAKAKKGRTT